MGSRALGKRVRHSHHGLTAEACGKQCGTESQSKDYAGVGHRAAQKHLGWDACPAGAKPAGSAPLVRVTNLTFHVKPTPSAPPPTSTCLSASQWDDVPFSQPQVTEAGGCQCSRGWPGITEGNPAGPGPRVPGPHPTGGVASLCPHSRSCGGLTTPRASASALGLLDSHFCCTRVFLWPLRHPC